MRFTKEDLSLENGLTKEWIITNGLGGFSSSTILGANTRKYHGLLLAPLTPPARRFLILSKLDEALEIEGKKYDLYTNITPDYISHGYQYQTEFRKEYIPVFTYQVEDVTITKMICMEYGKNTVGVYYKIKNGKNTAKLTLAPVVNFRDFHTMNTDHFFDIRQTIKGNKVKLVIDGQSHTPVYMHMSEGQYHIHENDTFFHMFYMEEEKRGFYPEENHAVTGVYEIEIKPNEEKEISFVCSMEDNIEQINVKDLINKEIIRLGELFNQSLLIENKNTEKTKKEIERDNLIKNFLIATDNFIVYRPNFGLHTIIAGYPWFLDWGRDGLISFEGLVLIPKRFDIAKEILLTMVRDIKYGLVPNGYSGYDNRPLYNSVDASLLLFEQVQKYLEYTGDMKFVKEKIYSHLEDIIQRMGAPEEVAREFNENMGVQPPRSHKKMIIIIIGLLVGVGLAVFLFIRSMIPEYTDLQDSSYFQQEQVAQIMAEVILDVSPLDEQSLIERCDETMAQTLTEHSLSEALESLGELGDFQRITSERYVEVNQNGYICVIGEIVALYQKRSVTYTITLDQNYQLAGLYMK